MRWGMGGRLCMRVIRIRGVGVGVAELCYNACKGKFAI